MYLSIPKNMLSTLKWFYTLYAYYPTNLYSAQLKNLVKLTFVHVAVLDLILLFHSIPPLERKTTTHLSFLCHCVGFQSSCLYERFHTYTISSVEHIEELHFERKFCPF